MKILILYLLLFFGLGCSRAEFKLTPANLTSTTMPFIAAVSAPANGVYNNTDVLNFSVSFSVPVAITGSPRIAINVGGSTFYATATTTSLSPIHNFRYTVSAAENDSNGVVLTSPLDLNSGTIKNGTGTDADLDFTLPNTMGLRIDNIVPTITSVTAPADGIYNLTDLLNFNVTFSEAVVITGTPRIAIDVGGTTFYANATTTASSTTHNFRYTVGAAENDSDGIVLTSTLDINFGTIRDAALNDSALTFSLPTTTGVLVDNTTPTIVSVTPPANGSYNNTDLLDFTVTFSEAVVITGTPRIAVDVGGSSFYATATTTTSSTTHNFRYTVGAAENDSNGIVLTSPMDLNAGTIRDAGLNNSALTFTLPTTTGVLVDNTAPTIISVTAPADDTYIATNLVDFNVTFSEAVVITGSPQISLTVGAATLYATAITSASSTTHTFRYTVGASDNDTDGIALSSPLGLNSGTIQDAALNNVSPLTFAPPTTTGILIDSTAPTITSVSAPANGTYLDTATLDFTLTFSEAVVITGLPRIAITVGTVTRYATATTTASSTTHNFRYTVADGDDDYDGIILISPLQLNSGAIQDIGGNNVSPLTFTLPNTSAVLIDTTANMPSGLTLVTSYTPNFLATPTIRVSGVTSGDTIKLFTDTTCTTEVNSDLAAGATIDLTSSSLAGGTYNFYATAKDARPTASACSTATVVYRRVVCPSGFVEVPKDALVPGDFCVMQFEAKNVAGVATSQATSNPWVSITRDLAWQECTDQGYDLISNPEWMTIARNVEATAANWEGAIGVGALYRGHSDGTPGGIRSVTNIADPYNNTSNTAVDPMGAGREQKRTYTLSNGSVIWDFAGNAREWISWTAGATNGDDGPTGCLEGDDTEFPAVTCVDLTAADYMPANPGLAPAYDSDFGLGTFKGGAVPGVPAGGAAMRGGRYNNLTTAGPFSIDLTVFAINASSTTGFRCVYR